jgi:hypothetical protein
MHGWKFLEQQNAKPYFVPEFIFFLQSARPSLSLGKK